MSLELVNTVASVGTLLVIAATAIAALVQLRHSRGSNQITALTECREVLESEAFARAALYVRREMPRLLEDPDYRTRLLNPPLESEMRQITVVGNFFESMGAFVKHDIIDAQIACDLWWSLILAHWEALIPVVAIWRRSTPGTWENFEYLARLSQNFVAKYPDGAYPKNTGRMDITDTYGEADARAGIVATGRV